MIPSMRRGVATENGRKGMDQRSSGRIVFIGAVHEAEPALRSLLESSARVVTVVTLDEPLASRTAGFVDLGPLATSHDVPMLRTINANDPGVVAALDATQPDLIVCVGWTRLLGDALLEVPRRGCVGFHASLLPRHRGRAPVNWAIIRGERITGNTMMMLAPGVDTGDIVDQLPVTIEPDDTCGTVYEKVAIAGAQMLRTHLDDLLRGTAPRRHQGAEGGDILPKRTPEMGITAWGRTPTEVHNWIRALTHPYPGAFTLLDGRRIGVWRATAPVDGDVVAEPGTLLGPDGVGIRVAVRDGSICVTSIEEEDAGEEPAAGWWGRRGLAPGARFDPVDDETVAWALGLEACPPAAAASGVAR